jgi:microcystin-dependent protein
VFDKLNTGTGISYSSDISYNVIIFSADITDNAIVQFDVTLLYIKPCPGLKIYKPNNKTGIYAEYLKEYINGTSGPFTGADYINSTECSFSLLIKDNGRGDEDNINGTITDPMIVSYNKSTTTTTTPPTLKEFKRYDYASSDTDESGTPAFTIVAYLLDTAPFGWQLCDGKVLTSMNNMTVFNKQNFSLNTPDMRGRIPMGVNPPFPVPTNFFAQTAIGQSGGREMHQLNYDQMPSHAHAVDINAMGWGAGGFNGFAGGYELGFNKFGPQVLNAGGSGYHNNMPPIFVLNYIIKQPTIGGTSYTIDYPYQNPGTIFKP